VNKYYNFFQIACYANYSVHCYNSGKNMGSLVNFKIKQERTMYYLMCEAMFNTVYDVTETYSGKFSRWCLE
jgi:hypothetical protein